MLKLYNSLIQNLNFNSYHGSWLTGFIKSKFDDLHFYDMYFSNPPKVILDNSLVYIDDEDFSSWSWIAITPVGHNVVFICKIKHTFNELTKLGHKCLYYPYWHIVDDAIAVRKLNFDSIDTKILSNYSFCCLNRNASESRDFLIQELEKLDLIKYGYVTYLKSTQKFTGLQSNPEMTHYTSGLSGFERHNHQNNNIGYSSNVANYFYIQKNITAPINISHETLLEPFFPTEKSFLAFFTKKIPIVLAEQGRIAELRNEGFDLFDDLINHSYDNEYNFKTKIQSALYNNREVLKKFNSNIDDRTQYNLNFLLGDWLDKKLNDLIISINDLTKPK